MRGRKSDSEFISQYISRCLQQGIVNSEDILLAAQNEIKHIDDDIKRVEDLKARRSKLLGIISLFEIPPIRNTISILPLFSLPYPKTCKQICNHLIHLSPNTDYCVIGIKDPEVLFCLKQLIEAKVIARNNDNVVRGERFDEYMRFILHQE